MRGFTINNSVFLDNYRPRQLHPALLLGSEKISKLRNLTSDALEGIYSGGF